MILLTYVDSHTRQAQYAKEAEAAARVQGLRDRVAASAASGGPPFDLSAESDDVRAGFEAIVRLGCRAEAVESHDPRDGDIETEPTDEVRSGLLASSLDASMARRAARRLNVALSTLLPVPCRWRENCCRH